MNNSTLAHVRYYFCSFIVFCAEVYFRKRRKKINAVGLTGEEELLEEENESKASEEKRGFEEE